MKIKILFPIALFLLVFFSCEKSNNTKKNDDNGDSANVDETPVLTDYFPFENGTKMLFNVNFPAEAYIPYRPIIEYPDGILCASGICGSGKWEAGKIGFEMIIDDIYEKTSTSTTWNITLCVQGSKFYFYQTDQTDINYRLRLTIENETAELHLIADIMDVIIAARRLASVSSDDLSQKYNITCEAGEFKNCVKSFVNIYGDGQFVSSGTYPIETYLAPDAGIIKAIGQDKDGTVLYTLEKTDSLYIDNNGNNGDNDDNDICFPQDIGCGVYYMCCTDSFCDEYYFKYNDKKYICETDSCTEAIDELIKDMCNF